MLPTGPNPFTQLSSEQIYKRKYVTFIKNMVKIDDHIKDYSYAQISNGVGIVALNDKNEITLVGQWRYPIGKFNWEIPAGMREENEDPLETAKRELKEEAGVTAKKWQKLGEFFMESSATTKKAFVFLAQDLEIGEQSLDDDERLELKWIPFNEALKLVESGELQDASTVLGILKTANLKLF